MKKHQFLLIMLFFLGFGQTITAQVFRYKATSFSVMEKDAKGKWMDWTDFEPSTVIITIDGKKDRVVIASQEIQLYKIMNYGDKVSTKTTDTVPLNCIDNDGGDCTILIITKKNEDDRIQFYVNYQDLKMVYNVYKVE
jgi:hypothetical protein